MSYAVDGVQYLAVVVAPPLLFVDPAIKVGPGRLLVFSLGGSATLPAPVARDSTLPPPAATVVATDAEVKEGGALFSLHCDRCHSPDLNLVKSGAVPDLRRSTAATHAAFDAIVRGGDRRTLGMPSFAADLDSQQVRWVQAYVLDRVKQAQVPAKTGHH